MAELSKRNLEKLNAVIGCNPTRCITTNCPNYVEECRACDAMRTMGLIYTIMNEKFKDVKGYNYESEDKT